MAESTENTIATNDNNAENVPSKTKLIPWATVYVDDLEVLPESDLVALVEKDRESINSFDNPPDNVLELVSNFSSVCLAAVQHFNGKCKYYQTLSESLSDEVDVACGENEELVQRAKLLENNTEKLERDKGSLDLDLQRLKEDLKIADRRNLDFVKGMREKEAQIEKLQDKLTQLSTEKEAQIEELQAKLTRLSIAQPSKESGDTTTSNSTSVGGGLPHDWSKICKNLTPFNPELRPNAGIEEFIATLKSKLSVRQPPYSDDGKLAILKMVVEGSASMQIQSYSQELQSDFDKLCGQLEKDFGRFSCQEAAIEALRGREGKQKPNETPSEFLRRLQRLSSKAFGFRGRDDVQLRLAFVDGLHPHIRQQLEALAISNLDDLVAKSEIFYHKRAHPKGIQVCEVKDGSNLSLEGGSKKTWSNPRIRRPRRIDCFRCGEPGHYARDCGKSDAEIQSKPTQEISAAGFGNAHQDGFMGYLKQIIDGYERQRCPQSPQVSTLKEPVPPQTEQ